MDPDAYALLLRRVSALERRVSAVFRTGKVSEVQLRPYRVRVDIGPDEEGRPEPTDLLPVLVPRAGEVRVWSPLTVGEGAAVLSPGGEDASAFVLPALISADFDQVADKAGAEVERWDALKDPGTEAGCVEVTRGATPAQSMLRLKMGRAMLELNGNGNVVLERDRFDIRVPS